MAAVTRPDFNEFPLWSPNCHPRNGIKPTMFLLHTQEGAGNALSLAQYLGNPANQVSYHYTVSEDFKDHGVTIVDCVDTDMASWSVMDFNNKALNLCFAGSTVNWSRDEWLQQSRAIDVAAYIAVADCRKYGIPLTIVPPPYSQTPGISDHGYVTSRGIGTHSDVGRNFPWDYFAAAVNKYSGLPVSAPVAPVVKPAAPAPAPKPTAFQYPSQTELLIQIWEQLLGPRGKGWPQLGGKTLVDAISDIKRKLDK
jgi:hypothetical protein